MNVWIDNDGDVVWREHNSNISPNHKFIFMDGCNMEEELNSSRSIVDGIWMILE